MSVITQLKQHPANQYLRGFFWLLPILLMGVSESPRAEILKVEIDGAIQPVVAQFIAKAIRQADEEKAEFLLIRMSTPGGLGVSMKEIIQEILNSPVPVVCYVAPQGSHAASAGFLILLAADVAVMAPGTNTGAAHPVFPFNTENKVMEEKVINDILANLRSIMEQRKRNYEMAREGVINSKSYTENEALEGNLIDLIAASEEDLFAQLDGFKVTRFSGQSRQINTRGQTVKLVEKTFREKVLWGVAVPEVALILGLIGLVGLYLEFTTPGTMVPGVVGGICLLLALLGFSVLPVNYVGVLLILLALALLVAEALVQGFGVLGIGGAISMVMGLIFLIDSPYPELRIGWTTAMVLALPFAAVSLFLMTIVVKNFRTEVVTGQEGLIGSIGQARTRVDEVGGKVFVQSELWNAVSSTPIEKGRRIQVTAINGLILKVEALEVANTD